MLCEIFNMAELDDALGCPQYMASFQSNLKLPGKEHSDVLLPQKSMGDFVIDFKGSRPNETAEVTIY